MRRPTQRTQHTMDPSGALTPPVDPKQEPVVSLAKINTTLKGQTKQINKQLEIADKQLEVADKSAVDIHATKEAMLEILKQQQSDNLDAIESRRERPEIGNSGTPGGITQPTPVRPSMDKSDAVSGMQNLMNNIVGSVIGHNLSFRTIGAAAVGALLGRGIKWGAVAFALDSIMNMALENFDVPPDLVDEIKGDAQRAIGTGFLAKMLGLKNQYAMIAAALGYFYEDISAWVQNLAGQEGIIQDAVKWLDQYTGGQGETALSLGTAAGTGLLANFLLNKLKTAGGKLIVGAKNTIVKGTPVVANAAWRGLKNVGSAARNAVPSVLSAVKSGASSVYQHGMRAVSAAGATGIVPLAATVGTMALFGKATNDYKQLLEDYPELKPMNNGQGPGLVMGKYLIENDLIKPAIEEQKRGGTYNNHPARETTREVPTIDPHSGAMLPSGVTLGLDPSSILDYLNKQSPIVPGANPIGKPITTMGQNNNAPQIVVVPVPTPAPGGGGKGGSSSTAIITPPVSSVDRLDLYDRVQRVNP
jgi:hypothetical protein